MDSSAQGAESASRRTLPSFVLRFCLIILASVFLCAWAPSIRDPSSGYQLQDSQVPAIATDAVPATAGNVLDVVDGTTGRVLVSERAYQKHAIGSITKLMTVVLALKHLSLNRVITVNSQAASEPGSTMWLTAGDRVTVRSLLYGALIPSGNDAAEALALAVSGTQQRFAALMNRQAHDFRLKCSHYVTPHGLDAPGEYSCAADVAHMTRIVLGYPVLAKIVDTKHIVVPSAGGGVNFNLTNTNLLLGSFPGIIGVKTGTTDAAGASVSAAARRAGHVVIAVVLGSTEFGRFSDAATLLTFAFNNYEWPTSSDTMWSTQSLMHHRAVTTAPVPRWESGWISVGKAGYVTAPFDPR